MELQLDYRISKNNTEKIPLPNMKSSSLIPSVIKFPGTITELEVSLFSMNNPILRYSESYFRVFREIDLYELRNKISDGEDLTLSIKNVSPKEILTTIVVVYEAHRGNVIFMNSYNEGQINFDKCLEDVATAGQITQLIIDSDVPISSVILDPIYKLSPNQEVDLDEYGNWSNSLAIQNNKPEKRIFLDFTDNDLASYLKFLKFYRLKINFATEEAERENKVHLIGFGFKSDKR